MDKQLTISQLIIFLKQIDDRDPVTDQDRFVWISVPDDFSKRPLTEIHITKENDLILVSS